MVSHEVLLHLTYESAVGADRFSTACAFKVEVTAVALVVSVYGAFSDVSGEPLYTALVYETLKASVCGSLRGSERVYYLVRTYAAVFLFQVFEYRLALAGLVSVFSVYFSQLLAA